MSQRAAPVGTSRSRLSRALPAALVLVSIATLGYACHERRSAPSGHQDADAVRAAYLQYWQVWLAASAGDAAAGAGLPAVTASRQLATLHASLRASHAAGHVARGTVSHRIDIESVGRQTAKLSDCVGLNQWLLYRASTGALLPQLRDRPAQAASYTLARTATGWTVTDSRLTGSC